MFFEYGTQTCKTGGGATFEGLWQTTTTPLHKADGAAHTWALTYDPEGAEGLGEMTLALDDVTYRAALASGHKEDGASFDRFGLFNQQISGDALTVYIDDLVLDGAPESFDSDPAWEGLNNRVTFLDRTIRSYHDFGYRRTNHAGGSPGEIGGLVWRIESTQPEKAGYYGAPIERLSLDNELRASGKVALVLGSADSAALIGWFNSHTAVGAPPPNFLGILVEGPSRAGHYFRPAFGSSDEIKAVLAEGPIILPNGAPHQWTLRYSPSGDDGAGEIVATLDGQEAALSLTPEGRKGNAVFDRFGILSWHRGGHCVEIYLDDLTYTTGESPLLRNQTH